MRLLLANGADPALAADNGTLPLHVAAGIAHQDTETRVSEAEHLEAVKLMLELGADLDAANAAGFNALHAATYAGFDTIVRFLADRGIKLNEKTKAGQTALGIAEGSTLAGFYAEHPSTAALLRLRKLGAVSEGALTAAPRE
jgi:ankyrin repeat protein